MELDFKNIKGTCKNTYMSEEDFVTITNSGIK